MGANVTTEFMNHFVNDWFLLSDFSDMFVGDLIAHGTSRSVYDYRMNPRYVIKIDRSGYFNNVTEWDIWNNMENKAAKEFLAPCVRISSCGRVLLQHKTKPITVDDLPTDVPEFFADLKVENWGRIGKKIVCHDYGNHAFFTLGSDMVKADWKHLIHKK